MLELIGFAKELQLAIPEVAPIEGDDLHTYLRRWMKTLNFLPDERWDALSDQIQHYYNYITDAHNCRAKTFLDPNEWAKNWSDRDGRWLPNVKTEQQPWEVVGC